MTTTRRLTYLEAGGLIRLVQQRPEVEYLFRHALIQDAAYEVMLQTDRKRLHLAAGETLERLYPDRLDELAPQLGRHFAAAGAHRRAGEYFVRAGDRAMAIYANAEAVHHYSQALALVRDESLEPAEAAALLLRLYNQRGRALELLSEYEKALDNYRELEAIAGKLSCRELELAALMGRATIRATVNRVHDPLRGKALLEKAHSLAHELGDRAAEARVLWNLMLVNTFIPGSSLAERIAYGEQALAITRELNLRELMAFTLHDLWYAYASNNQWQTAHDILVEGRELWRELGNQPLFSENLSRTSVTYLILGEYDQAIAAAEESYRIGEASNNVDAQANSHMMVGLAYLDRGEIDQAMAVMENGLVLGEPTGNLSILLFVRADLGWVYGLLGAVERGLALARAAAQAAQEKAPLLRPWPLATVARLYVLQGDVDQATAVLDGLEDYHHYKEQLGFLLPMWVGVALARGEIALASGEHEKAAALAAGLATELVSAGVYALRPDAFYLQGKALLALGQWEEARQVLGQARAAAEVLVSRRTLWLILAALSQLERRQGNLAAAEALLREAAGYIHFIANHTGRPDLRASFLERPEVRAVLAGVEV
ncbi:MAG: hypothetical protein L0332_08460 [Chloroflexi bacterium]|nr:hypothetical protein [Chloroflexota bacterium]MCI0576367.1 hypothetical protein [Chloroflexota bacterium]MCI0646200.1 hypothetical protein [Chloroflexota bacterium]MCI0726738.1 hypothetical protein [Chloroflexota bacterium]